MQWLKFRKFYLASLLLLLASALLAACGALPLIGVGQSPPTPTPEVPQPGAGGFVRGLAPVESISIEILESFPAQVQVTARGNLPDSCTTIERTDVSRQENTFFVTIFTTRPRDAVCALVVIPFEQVVPLDVLGLKAGVYLVEANGQQDRFEFLVDNSPVVKNASVSGKIWHDLCAVAGGEGGAPIVPTVGCVRQADGSYRADGVLGAEEPAIAGVLVRLGLGVCPASGLATATAGSDGSFSFSELAPGTYCVSIEPLEAPNTQLLIPGAWTAPAEASRQGAAAYSITLGEAENRQNVNFGWDFQFLPEPPVLPTPTPTTVPTATPRPALCDAAQFVADVTVPDQSAFTPGTDFTKVWRLKNVGTCTWDRNYDLVFVRGDRMGAPSAVAFTKTVKPGETVDLAVDLEAPDKTGDYGGEFQLRNADGKLFGIGANADKSFWVRIQVKNPTKVYYDFVKNFCEATWRNDNTTLPCPTGENPVEMGAVSVIANPQWENGAVDNEPALFTHPEWIQNGAIHGRFPAVAVKSGDRFRAVIGCLHGAQGCNVTFQLRYRLVGGTSAVLAEWTEKYDGNIRKVDVDLSSLAGEEVQFILTVEANGSFDHDWAIWLGPRLMR